LSSTTDPRRSLGQVLPLFALASVAILMVAALAFDTGAILVERRDQQNAADAAALAGARFMPANPTAAEAAARRIATANGFTHGSGAVGVAVNIPPTSGVLRGQAGYIEVLISNTRPSIFAGIMGRSEWPVGTRAVAANERRGTGPFALLSTHLGCVSSSAPLIVEGQGILRSNGNIQVNSSCTTGYGAFRIAGTGSLTLSATGVACNIVGSDTQGSNVTRNDCRPRPDEPATVVPDPFGLLPTPPKPALPRTPQRVIPDPGMSPTPIVPDGCPGAVAPNVAATDAAPRKCIFEGGQYHGTTWRLFPGYYPGGIDLRTGSFLFEPGIYWIGDGGFRTAGGGVGVTSVAAGGTTFGGGILLFNSTHPSTATSPGPVILQGGDSRVQLLPLAQDTPWDGMVIFQDRAVTLTVEIKGGASSMDVRGLIYAPTAKVEVEGNTGTLTMDQVVASTVSIKGNGGTINVLQDTGYVPNLRLAGLVE
jgi:hypothetical protein